MKKTLMVASIMLLAASFSYAQTSKTGDTDLKVTVGAEAAIVVNTATSGFTSSGIFGDYTANTSLTYYIRTITGGTISLQITSDFACGGGPCVATPPSTGDALTYVNTVSAPGLAVSGTQTASTAATSPVATFGADIQSSKTGNSASVAWTLTNDPHYKAGTYDATATFTIAAV